MARRSSLPWYSPACSVEKQGRQVSDVCRPLGTTATAGKRALQPTGTTPVFVTDSRGSRRKSLPQALTQCASSIAIRFSRPAWGGARTSALNRHAALQ